MVSEYKGCLSCVKPFSAQARHESGSKQIMTHKSTLSLTVRVCEEYKLSEKEDVCVCMRLTKLVCLLAMMPFFRSIASVVRRVKLFKCDNFKLLFKVDFHTL